MKAAHQWTAPSPPSYMPHTPTQTTPPTAFFFFKQKTAYEIDMWLEFRRVLFRSGEGVLINMSSVWGRVTTPSVSPYVTSKFAVRAFSECLRHELRDTPGIAVA